jgi:fumarylacetoacetase
LPAWGVVRPRGGAARVALRAGDDVLLPRSNDAELGAALAAGSLNALIELGPEGWREAAVCDGERVPLSSCEALLPMQVADYVDFYASEDHAKNFGRLWRPGRPVLNENWYRIPIGYHGRASTVVVSGTDVTRPAGMLSSEEFGPSRMLDLECEIGFVCGPSAEGPVPIEQATDHIFGVVLLNDWSARDIQRFEYVPLGPFLGKSFATSISAWVTPLSELLEVARVTPVAQDPAPAKYLRSPSPWTLDIELSIEIDGEVLSRPNASWLYWTPEQMLAHMTVNGARLSAGDLFGSGTVSGSKRGTEGSLGEIGRGEKWLADGDEVVLRGVAGGMELGEVRGRVVPTPG